MRPQTLGLRKSFGFGDRLGRATPGHVAAVRGADFAPVFAQQSVREMTRTQRTPEEVLEAAVRGLRACGWEEPWGADADHLKTPEDVARTAAAGFTLFTIDPSDYVENGADRMDREALAAALAAQVAEGALPADWLDSYRGPPQREAADLGLAADEPALMRAAVKYGRCLGHCERMAAAIASHGAGRAWEIELSVDETASPTRPEEHWFVARELQRRRIPIVSLAPRFPGDFEKGIDYRGDLARFEAQLRLHVAVARACGPYKLGIHSGSDKFAVYPAIGRVCGELLHVKTAGTSYLEALRTVARAAPGLFGEIAAFARARFATDRASYHISTTDQEIAALPPWQRDREAAYLDKRPGRQLLHVTFGSVLTVGRTGAGQPFREAIGEVLDRHADLHHELVAAHLGRHLQALRAG